MSAAGSRASGRCPWCGDDPLYVSYHDQEWGVPLRDDRALFELLCLEGAQAGLSWLTILRKRVGYRRAFADFEAVQVASFNAARIERLVADASIVRHRGKIEAVVQNARALLQLQSQTSLADFVWRFVDGRPVQNRRATLTEVPAETAESAALSKALRKVGFGFVGSTTCYAFMQAAGLVNDHLTSCPRHAVCAELGSS